MTACLEAQDLEASGSAAVAEFSAARSSGGFEATGPAEAEGDGDVRCVAAVTAAAPAEMAGAANFQGDADNVGASAGADGASGAVDASEFGQTLADVGGFDLDEICIVGGEHEKADRAELAGGSAKTMGAEETDTELPISEVTPRPDPGRQYVGWVDGRWQVRWSGGGSRAATLSAGNAIDDSDTGLGNANNDGGRLGDGGRVWSRVGWLGVQGGCGPQRMSRRVLRRQ